MSEVLDETVSEAREEAILIDATDKFRRVRERALNRSKFIADGVSNHAAFKVNSQADCDHAADVIADIKSRKIRIDYLRDFIRSRIEPFIDKKGAGFDAHRVAVDSIATYLKAQIGEYRTRLREEAARIDLANKAAATALAAEKQRQIDEALAAQQKTEAAAAAIIADGGSKLLAIQLQQAAARSAAAIIDAQQEVSAALAVPTVVAELPKSEGVSYRRDIEITINDIDAVPAEFVVVTKNLDVRAVKRFVKETPGSPLIPGLTYKDIETLLV